MHFSIVSWVFLFVLTTPCCADFVQSFHAPQTQKQIPQSIEGLSKWGKEEYDCFPDVYSRRHSLPCDTIGDANAVLLSAALTRCRMPHALAPEWMCRGRNVRELQACVKKTPQVVFLTLVDAYFEMFEYCSKKISDNSVKFIYDLAVGLLRVSEQSNALHEEELQLLEEIKALNEKAASVQKDAVDVVDEMKDARKAGMDATAAFMKLITVLPDGDSKKSATTKNLIAPASAKDSLHGTRHFVRDAIKALDTLTEQSWSYSWKVGQAAKLSTRVSSFLYIWAAVSTFLVLKRTRWSSWFLDIFCFSLIFFVCALLTSLLLKLLLIFIATFVFLATSSEAHVKSVKYH